MVLPPDYRLRLPGPTSVPERVRNAMAIPMMSHRGPEFRKVLGEATEMVRPVFGTKADVLMVGASGTGGMEAALANVLSPGDAILVASCGQFGERFIGIAGTMGAKVDSVEVPWGQVIDPAAVADRLKSKTYRAVVCVHNESSTGSLPDDDFWHLNAVAGYRFPRRRAEIAVGLLNITDQDYRLNPLNSVIELPRGRTFVVSMKFNL